MGLAVSLTEFFIPDDYTESSLERRRAEIAIKMVFVVFPFGLLGTLFVHWLFASPAMTFGLFLMPLSLAMAPIALRRTGSMKLASLFILTPVYGVVTWYALATGGLFGPSVSILLLLPPMALIFLGARAAGIWLVIVVATWAAMFGAELAGFDGASQFDPERYPVRRMTELMILAGTISGMFYLKDNLQDWLVASLREKEAETRAVLETAPDGILTMDVDGKVLNANEAASLIFGCPGEELLGAHIEDLVCSLSADHLGTDGSTLTEFGVTEEHRGRRDKEEFPLEIAFGLLNDTGEPKVVLVLRDITDRKAGEQQLRDARDEAVEASRAKSTFLANMSHELRTPLNAVIGYSELLIEEIEEVQRSEDIDGDVALTLLPDVERIRSAGGHLLALINDILDLSKIEAGKMTTHIESFDVEELVDDIMATVRPLAAKNGNSLEVEIVHGVSRMRSDQTKLRQILFNLLSNACKFTKQGTIDLRVELDDTADQVVFHVTDTGIGMTEEQMADVFEAFKQADDSTTRQFGGTGLGLTITSHFCSFLGGDIDVTSTPGEGTTFTVRLTRDLRQGEGGSGGEDGEESLDQGRVYDEDADTVLVIDDQRSVRDLLRRMLEREGFAVATAATGSEGLLLAEKLKPCAITLDVMMPSMDGWTMLTKLKSNPELKDIPVIMVTMHAEQSRGYALGANHYLVKPVQRRELVELIGQYGSDGSEAGQVLIVEDDEPTRSLMKRLLLNEGWKVREATNGREALEIVDEMTPSLVLLDLMMPEMDGIQFLRRFREDDTNQDIPVIVVTAKELTAEEERRLQTQVTEILTKGGTDTDRLLAQVRKMVRQVTSEAAEAKPRLLRTETGSAEQ